MYMARGEKTAKNIKILVKTRKIKSKNIYMMSYIYNEFQ